MDLIDLYYASLQDVFDAFLNTLFPILFPILFNMAKTGPIKRIILPVLDDILYNIVAWIIPLTVFLIYDRFHIFVIILYLICGLLHLINLIIAIKRDEKFG